MEIVRDICDVNWLILRQNVLYLQLSGSRTGLVLQGARVKA